MCDVPGWANWLVALVGVVVSAIISGIGIVVSIQTAKKYGDVAGTRVSIDYEKKKAADARVSALTAVLSEVTRIRKLIDLNWEPTKAFGLLRMPTAAFVAAFLSGTSALSVSSETLDTVVRYLAYAEGINSLIENYHSLASSLGTNSSVPEHRRDIGKQIVSRLNEIAKLLDPLDVHLKREKEQAALSAAALDQPTAQTRKRFTWLRRRG